MHPECMRQAWQAAVRMYHYFRAQGCVIHAEKMNPVSNTYIHNIYIYIYMYMYDMMCRSCTQSELSCKEGVHFQRMGCFKCFTWPVFQLFDQFTSDLRQSRIGTSAALSRAPCCDHLRKALLMEEVWVLDRLQRTHAHVAFGKIDEFGKWNKPLLNQCQSFFTKLLT